MTDALSRSAESNTQLAGWSLWLARAAWGMVALFSIGYYVVWTTFTIQQPMPSCTVDSGECNPFYLNVQDLAVVSGSTLPIEAMARATPMINALASMIFIVVGLFLFWRKSDDGMALWLSAVILALGAVGSSGDTTSLIGASTLLYKLINAVAFFGYFAPFATLFFFPDGRFVPRWCRWVCVALIIPVSFLYLSDLMSVGLATSLDFVFLPLLPIIVVIGVGSMVYRYRRIASPQQRQQIKWVAFGLFMGSLNVIVWILYELLLPARDPNPTRTIIVAITFPIVSLLLPIFPISIAIAVVRYRLWDIDVLIRRTVTYALVTALLVIVFFGSVILLQRVFSLMTGSGQNEIVTVISTLAIAALFVPVRGRVQAVIDRRFNRARYDAQRVLNDFATTVRDETDLEKLTGRLVQVVDETMQPRTVSVWLKKEAE